MNKVEVNANVIKKLMAENKHTQRVVADEMGTSERLLNAKLNDRRNLTFADVVFFARKYNKQIEFFLKT